MRNCLLFNENISMPYAEVDCIIEYELQVNVSCRFVLNSNISDEQTLAFVFPSTWMTDTTIHTMSIRSNETEFPFITEDWEYFNFTSGYYHQHTGVVSPLSYAVFNVTFVESTTTVIYIEVDFKVDI